MKLFCRYFFSIVFAVTFVACSSSEEDDEPYPSVITELGILRVDKAQRTTLQTDGGAYYRISTKIEGLQSNVSMRVLCSYLPDGAGAAEVYTLQAIYVLPDVTKELTPAVYDPVGFVSAWKGGGFINLHLLPKTKANLNNHVWGFIRDNQRTNSAGGTTYELSLYHDQKADPLAYSNDLYLSLAIDSVSKSFGTQDSIELKVQGFDQQRILKYGK